MPGAGGAPAPHHASPVPASRSSSRAMTDPEPEVRFAVEMPADLAGGVYADFVSLSHAQYVFTLDAGRTRAHMGCIARAGITGSNRCAKLAG